MIIRKTFRQLYITLYGSYESKTERRLENLKKNLREEGYLNTYLESINTWVTVF